MVLKYIATSSLADISYFTAEKVIVPPDLVILPLTEIPLPNEVVLVLAVEESHAAMQRFKAGLVDEDIEKEEVVPAYTDTIVESPLATSVPFIVRVPVALL